MYFSADQVSVCFKRLSSRKNDGKTHLERTSSLMYFLAFDAACKTVGNSSGRLDLNPARTEGKNNRKAIELEFTKFVLLDRSHGHTRQVSELGKVDCTAKDPEKRISSNFLTVPLKKASEQADPYFYPKRPKAPLITLGQNASGIKWGIGYHTDWINNLPIFLSEIKESTPFTDLAIFIMRDTLLNPESKDYIDALSSAFKDRFSASLAKFWIERIQKEKILVRHINNPFSAKHEPFAKPSDQSDPNRFEGMHLAELIAHIDYLEGLLQANQIDITPVKKAK